MNLTRMTYPVSLLLVGIGLAVNGYSQSFLTNGLVVYYPFNGNANDASGNGNNGTVQGATLTADRFGNANSAYYFNGVSSDILLPETLFGATIPACTVSVWITTDGGPYSAQQMVLQKSTLNGPVAIAVLTNYLFFGIETASGGFYNASAPLLTNSTMHLVGVYQQGHSLTLYTNGVLASMTSIPNENLLAGGLPISSSLGCYHYNAGPYLWFRGTLDDFRVYTLALSASEVQQLYAYESTNTCVPHGAAATPELVNGFVVGATITDSGCGYTNTPPVLIQGGGGTGATATAVVSNGVVVNLIITDAGVGYTSAPTISIGSPFGVQVALTKAVRPSFSNLLVGLQYQLQVSGDLLNWTNQGSAFTATNAIVPYPQYWDVDNWSQLFFRLKESP